MSHLLKQQDDSLIKRLLPLALLLTLLSLSYKVVAFFISPIIWAAIFAYITWPIYIWLDKKIPNKPNFNAFIMSAGLTLLIGVPVFIGVFVLQNEAVNLYNTIIVRIQNGYLTLPQEVIDLPAVGSFIQKIVDEVNVNPEKVLIDIQTWIQSHLYYGKEIANVVMTTLAQAGFSVLMLFFFYKDGREIAKQIYIAGRLIIGERATGYFNAMGMTTQAVVYGIGLTAIAQAILAGVGYYATGAPSPMLLILLTLFVALIPFGTPFAWGGVALYLLSKGQTTEAIGLIIWGTAVVSSVDNIIRPIVISGATKIPFIIILIGVLGGLTTFGFLGLFLGPVILALALAVWREWVAQQIDETILMASISEEQLCVDDESNS